MVVEVYLICMRIIKGLGGRTAYKEQYDMRELFFFLVLFQFICCFSKELF